MMKGPAKTAPRGELYLSTIDLEHLLRDHVASRLGVPLPVYGEVTWTWSPGLGPVARVTVEHLPNVHQLRPEGRR